MNWLLSLWRMPTPAQVLQRELDNTERELIVAAREFEDARGRYDTLRTRRQRLLTGEVVR